MAKSQYVAQNRICGLKPPAKNKEGTLVEDVVEIGDVVTLDDDAAAPLVAGGALAPKSTPPEPTPAA